LSVGKHRSRFARSASGRRAPILPAQLEGQLFPGDPSAASKRLNRFLNDTGIRDPRKVVHSLRHRAQDVCGLPVAPKIAVGQF